MTAGLTSIREMAALFRSRGHYSKAAKITRVSSRRRYAADRQSIKPDLDTKRCLGKSTKTFENCVTWFKCAPYIVARHDGVALTFFRRYNRFDWCFCTCVINVKSLICSERTMHLWYKYYGLFVRMYINSLQSYLSQINTWQTSFEAWFDSKRQPRDCSAP